MKSIKQILTGILPAVRDLRRRLHANPELSYQEFETSRLLRDLIGSLPGASIESGLARTGFVATFGKDLKGPCLALRADMDALPILEQSGKPYSSTRPGVMHACGHDGHSTCLYGTAVVLSELQDQLKGPVKLLFQPAEEDGAGARRMVLDGCLKQPDVDAVFGLHGWPSLPIGTVSTVPGAIMAGENSFSITVRGVGAHAAMPHKSVDPVVVASHLVVALQSIVARRIAPTEAVVITVGQIQAGTATNIIPDSAVITGTVRALSDATREVAIGEIERIAYGTGQMFDAVCDIVWEDGYPAVVNEPVMTEFFHSVVAETLGTDALASGVFPQMTAEDFSFYLKEVPGCFFALGLLPEGVREQPGLHHPEFDFNDDALETGIHLLSELAMTFASRWKRLSNEHALMQQQERFYGVYTA